MSKRLIVVLALLFVVGSSFAAYAEVQNVKVSGDILASGVYRSHFGLTANDPGDKSVLRQSFLMSQIRLRVDADLTDNVMATVRLINERIWNGSNDTTGTDKSSIDLDLAFVTLKEFLYSPLSVTVGRQEIRFGNGLIMGNAKADVNGTGNIPMDLSERKAFDAIRATLNYDPLVIDLIYAQTKQLNSVDRSTISLTGINASYEINKKVNVSGYYYFKKDNFKGGNVGRGKEDKVQTVGALVNSTPIENLNVSGEVAYQFGRNDSTNTTQIKHDAWAFQLLGDYTFAKVKMTPKIGMGYTYLSGSKNTSDSRNRGWDPMFYDQKLNNIVYAILPFTNMSVINLSASCKPMDDVTLSAVYGWYDVAKKANSGSVSSPFWYDSTSQYLTNVNYTNKRHLGEAIDVTATYDYTEDVQLGLTYGWFRPGDALALNTGNTSKSNASQVIGSMKVIF